MGGAGHPSSAAVHQGKAGKVSGSRANHPPHQQVLILVPTLEIPWDYFHWGSLWCCQEGIKEKIILCPGFIRGQLWYSLKGFFSFLPFHLFPNNRGSLLTNLIFNRKWYCYLSQPLAKPHCFYGKQMAKLDKNNLDCSCLSAKLFSNSNWNQRFSSSLQRGWCQHVARGKPSQLSKDCSNGWIPSPGSQRSLSLLSTSPMFSQDFACFSLG